MEDVIAAVALLRGVPVSAVLSRGSKVFHNSKGSAETYELSVPADHLECFVSHTWNTPRWRKHVALSLQFNFVGAYALAFLVGVLVVVLNALQLLPVVETVACDGVEEPRAPSSMLAVFVVFHVALNSACSPLLRFNRSLAFVDKACIHQTDVTLKQRGIENLSTFIFFSWDFVVLHTNNYLQRLWTVYEMASHLILQPQGRILTLDLDAAPTVFLASAFWMIKQWGVFVSKIKRLEGVLPSIIVLRGRAHVPLLLGFIPLLWLTSLLRRRAKAHTRSIDELLQNFSVRSAACVCEADRAPVERNIVEMLKSQGQLARDGRREEGMDMFDQLVRERLPPALHVRCCHRDALAVGIVLLGEAFDSVAFSKQRLTLGGFCDGVSTHDVFVEVMCVGFGLEVVVYIMRLNSATSDMFLFVLVLTTAFCSVAAYLLMAQRSMWPRKAPKHCTKKVDSMIAASKLHLTLDLGGHSCNSSTSSSSSRDASAECPSSGVSACEKPVGDMHAAVIFRPSGPGTRTVRL